MKKQELLELLDVFPYDRKDYWLTAGGAMVFCGIREETSDLDLGCSTALADRLETDGFLFRYTNDGKRWFRFGDRIEIFERWMEDEVTELEGFRLVSVEGLIAMKRALGREKDLRDLELISAYSAREAQTKAQRGDRH